ncbi:active breakpoint cluster region-related protein isoform X2 [Amia ocellicauda]|uniref:active breakpoint cluster region-related protein isoform X2 n=1 Tax=Amia ocellicauda TaxID=2972642 RepID=UPI0034640B99
MEVYNEAVDYLQAYSIPVPELEPDVLEDVFGVDGDEDLPPITPSLFSPQRSFSADFPDTPTGWDPEKMLQRRLVVLRSILASEELYLTELETLLTPMKALKATACTSQPVLSNQEIRTVFYQVPELRDLHRDFYNSLRERLGPGELQTPVGDVFQKMVSQLGVYRGFIDNYESALETVRKCTQTDTRFKTLAESMMSFKGSDNSKTMYTFEALLYKPLDRVTKTTLVLHDLLKHTPPDHPDCPLLQEALRISSSFLSGVNEESQKKSSVTLSKGQNRQLVKDGFLVDFSEGVRSLRHIFLYTDLLLCAKLKGGWAGKQAQYRFGWYLPLAGLRLQWGREQELPAEVNHTREKMFQLRQEIEQQSKGGRVSGARTIDRSRRKMQEYELQLLTHSPTIPLELHSPNGKSHTLLLSSLYELSEWREAIEKLKGVETVPPDLLNLTSSCVKLRMVHQPPLISLTPAPKDGALCGTLGVAVHGAAGLQEPASLYVCLEVDGFQFFENKAQTRASLSCLEPQWDEEFSMEVDETRCLRVLCVQQPERGDGNPEDRILGKASVPLDARALLKKWRKMTVSINQVELSLSLKFSAHTLEAPGSAPPPSHEVFKVLIGLVAEQEGVLVPHIVRSCIEEVERRGMEEVGIYRISGGASDIQTLKNAFNTSLRDAVSRLRDMDVNAVSGTLKLYFRELPEPLFPPVHFNSLTEALEIQDRDAKTSCMLSILQSCPTVNRNTFLFLMHHLKRVSEKQDINKMTPLNLATVFGPSLLRPPQMVLGQTGPQVDISQEVVVQVQVAFFYLQCESLPPALTVEPLDSDEDTEF